MSMAAKAVSQALSDSASVMPDRCSTRAASICSRGRSAGRMRLAAEPLAEEAELMPGRAVADEVDRGVAVAVGAHAAVIDTFAVPQRAQRAAV